MIKYICVCDDTSSRNIKNRHISYIKKCVKKKKNLIFKNNMPMQI